MERLVKGGCAEVAGTLNLRSSMSILLRLRYDGTDFCGFARQPEMRTVQGELESALTALYRCPITTWGASRTDSGVHAMGQLVAFEPPETTSIPLEGLLRAMGGFLPPDLSLWDAWEEEGDGQRFINPRFGNGGKRYCYRIRSAAQRDPLQSRYLWDIRVPLDVAAMQRAASYLVGEHDFSSFRAADCQAAHAVRRLDALRVEVRAHDPSRIKRRASEPWLVPALIEIHVEGTAFLKYMVRIISGTLIAIGKGHHPPEWMQEVLAAKDRTQAGPTAPAHGLTLIEVLWS